MIRIVTGGGAIYLNARLIASVYQDPDTDNVQIEMTGDDGVFVADEDIHLIINRIEQAHKRLV